MNYSAALKNGTAKGGSQHDQKSPRPKTKLNPEGQDFSIEILKEVQHTIASIKEDLAELKSDMSDIKKRVIDLEYDMESIKNPIPNYGPTTFNTDDDMIADYSGQMGAFYEKDAYEQTETMTSQQAASRDQLLEELKNKDGKIDRMEIQIGNLQKTLQKLIPQDEQSQ